MTAAPGFTYAFDGANRMKQAQQTASPNTITTSTYFGALRIKKVVGPPGGPNTTTTYIYSDKPDKPGTGSCEKLVLAAQMAGQNTIGNCLGYLSIAVNLTFWFLVWNPAGWRLGFKSDVGVALLAACVALLASIIATVKASRWWGSSIASSLLMFLFWLSNLLYNDELPHRAEGRA